MSDEIFFVFLSFAVSFAFLSRKSCIFCFDLLGIDKHISF